jgi:hypothetical protein
VPKSNPSHLWVDALLEEAQGFSLEAMAKTTGKMIRGADRIAERLADMALLDDSDPRVIKDLSQSLRNVAQSIEVYAGVHAWCEQYGQTGKDTYNSLQELIPYLDGDELHTLQRWMARVRV